MKSIQRPHTAGTKAAPAGKKSPLTEKRIRYDAANETAARIILADPAKFSHIQLAWAKLCARRLGITV